MIAPRCALPSGKRPAVSKPRALRCFIESAPLLPVIEAIVAERDTGVDFPAGRLDNASTQRRSVAKTMRFSLLHEPLVNVGAVARLKVGEGTQRRLHVMAEAPALAGVSQQRRYADIEAQR